MPARAGPRPLPAQPADRRAPCLSGLLGAITLHGVALTLLLAITVAGAMLPDLPPGTQLAMVFLPPTSPRCGAESALGRARAARA